MALEPWPAESQAARALVKWKQEDLAKAAASGVSTVENHERERRKPQARNLTATNEAFAQVGITFFDAGETRLIVHRPESKADDCVQGMPCVPALPQPTSCRAARELLNWMQIHMAGRAQVGISTVRDYEWGDRNPQPRSLAAIQQASTAAGVEFLAVAGGQVLK